MRVFGYGLAGFDEKEVTDTIKSLYSRWFVFLEFNSRMPKIDNHLFWGWIRDAMREAQADDARRMETDGFLRQIGRGRMLASTVCARCGSAAVEMAIREDGAVKAYCLACVEQMKEERAQHNEKIISHCN